MATQDIYNAISGNTVINNGNIVVNPGGPAINLGGCHDSTTSYNNTNIPIISTIDTKYNDDFNDKNYYMGPTTASEIGAVPNTTTGLIISFSGDWLYSYPMLLVQQYAVASGIGTGEATSFAAQTGVGINRFLYSETSSEPCCLNTLSFDNLSFVADDFYPTGIPHLTTLNLPILQGVGRNFGFDGLPLLNSFTAPQLRIIGNDLTISHADSLTGLSLPLIKSLAGSFVPSSLYNLTNIDMDNLTLIGGNFTPIYMSNLTSISLTDLQAVKGAFRPFQLSGLLSLSCPSLTGVNGLVGFSGMPVLTGIYLPSLISMNSGFHIKELDMATYVNLPSLLNIDGDLSIRYVNSTSLTGLNLPLLNTVRAFYCLNINNSNLKYLDLPSLTGIFGTLTLNGASGLTGINFNNVKYIGDGVTLNNIYNVTNIEFPSLVDDSGNFTFVYSARTNGCTGISLPVLSGLNGTLSLSYISGYPFSVNASSLRTFGVIDASYSTGISEVTIGTVGITRVSSGNCTITGAKLNVTSVDNILGVYASLNGQNGTIRSTSTVSLQGGSNAAPSFSGLIYSGCTGIKQTPDAQHYQITASGHALLSGDMVTISGTFPTSYNGTYIIDGISTNTFNILNSGSTAITGTATVKCASYKLSTEINPTTPNSISARITCTGHGWNDNQVLAIYGTIPTGFNGIYRITGVTPNTFDIVNSTTGSVTSQAHLSQYGFTFAQIGVMNGRTISTN